MDHWTEYETRAVAARRKSKLAKTRLGRRFWLARERDLQALAGAAYVQEVTGAPPAWLVSVPVREVKGR